MPELRRRPVRWIRLIFAAAVAGSVLLALVPLGTYARWSDTERVGNLAGAGAWFDPPIPPVPAACAAVGFSPDNIFVLTADGSYWTDGIGEPVLLGPGIPGSTANGAFHGTDDDDLIVNAGPRRTIHGIGGDDCIVAGIEPDILHGGDGSDVLIGGKKQHKGEYLHPAGTPFAAASTDPLDDPATEGVILDGEVGIDVCHPGAADTTVDCEVNEPAEEAR